MSNIRDLHQEIIDALHKGDFVGPIEKFYAEDVVAQANTDAPSSGRDAIAAAEADYVKGVTAFHGVTVHGTAIDDQGDGNGVVFYECEMHWEHTGRGKVDIHQTVVERWKNSKIASIRFYGDIGL
jgi:ketosteroid isomerase-like protein